MISNISRRKIRKLLRENSSESSLSKSMSNAPDHLTELSLERVRGALKKDAKRIDLSMKNLQALFKIYQMENNKLINFAGFFRLSDHQASKYLNTFSNFIANAEYDKIQENWYHLLSLKIPQHFDSDCISFVTIIHNILHHRIIDPIPSLLLLNYLIILTFWQDFGSLSMDKSNLLMDHLKGIVKALVKIVKLNRQELYNGNYLQLIENVGSELYPFLLKLFQIIKKKSNYYYCFICLSEIMDKLTKKSLLRSLGMNTLNQLELSLNKNQKLIFEEIFLRQADPVVDRNLIFKSSILKPYKEDLFNAFLAFEYRNNINFTKLLYFFDNICEICQKIESENPKTFEKTLEFKMLIKTLTEIFEYFCSKLSNLNTEFLLMLDEELEQIAYLARFLSRKKRQELSNAYIKVNGYFDKEPSEDVIQILDLMETNVKKVKQESKKKKKGNDDFSNKVLASLKIMKKIDSLQKRVHEMTELFDMMFKNQEYLLSTKAKLKTGKAVLKIMDMVAKQKEIDNSFRKEVEEFLIMFLKVPSLIHKAILKKLKQRYELFIQEYKVQGRAEVFKLINQNLQLIFMSDEKTNQLQGLPVQFPNMGPKTMETKVKCEEDEDEDDEDEEEEDEEEEDDDDDEDDEEQQHSHKYTKEKIEIFTESHQTTKISLSEDSSMKGTILKKSTNESLQNVELMLKDHFGDLILGTTVIIVPDKLTKYLMNIDSLFHESSNHIMNSLVNMSSEDVDQLTNMFSNIVRNIALNLFANFNTKDILQEIKSLLQNYRKFLKCAEIFSRFNYHLVLDGSNNILAHSFLPLTIDSKNEIIEYNGKDISEPGKKEKIYDIEYFLKLEPLDVSDGPAYLSNFTEKVCTNKVRNAAFLKIREEAKKNPSLVIYGYADILEKDGSPKHLVVSYMTEDGTRKFIILPGTMNVITI